MSATPEFTEAMTEALDLFGSLVALHESSDTTTPLIETIESMNLGEMGSALAGGVMLFAITKPGMFSGVGDA